MIDQLDQLEVQLVRLQEICRETDLPHIRTHINMNLGIYEMVARLKVIADNSEKDIERRARDATSA